MVSPSKYCKTPKRDFKIGIERLKKDRVKVQIGELVLGLSMKLLAL